MHNILRYNLFRWQPEKNPRCAVGGGARFATLPALVLLAACAAGPRPSPVEPPRAHPVQERPPVVVQPTAPRVPDTVAPGRFDTGKMWTFENPPLDYFQAEYGFLPSEEWLRAVRLGTLRLPNCTASFVSPQGLVLTNHHCAREAATAVSGDGEDLLEAGFYATRAEEERRVAELYVDQLLELRDVTAEVRGAAGPGDSEEHQVAARDSAAAAVAERLGSETGLRCDVTSLYYGGRYSAYCYRRYDDVRLVFVPEGAVGYFGGDPDNFTYPRYAFDVAFFRVYGEDGRPVTPEHYFRWSARGPRAGETVFVIGNPGSTSRLNTLAQLEYKRDHQYPFTVRLLESRAAILADYMKRHPESRPKLINDYFSITNSLKAFTGELRGLRDPALMARKAAFEREFKAAVLRDSALRREYDALWDEIADLRRRIARVAPRLNGLNQGGVLRSSTLLVAAQLLQYGPAAASGQVPDSLLEPFRAEIEGMEIEPELDAAILAAQLEDAGLLLGEDDPFVRAALAGRAPDVAARAVIDASALVDPVRRAALLDRPAEILTSDDPALRLMREALPRLQQAGTEFRRLSAQEEVRAAALARALFEIYGTTIPPDATFTLRIADGVVGGYQYNGTAAPPVTTFFGMYDRHHSHAELEDWALPERWLRAPPEFDLATPLNVVSTNDIIGGNSGSPLVNRAGEIVGVVFDGNIESLSGDFIYTTDAARAISVHSEGILEALRDLYRATRLVRELEAARTR